MKRILSIYILLCFVITSVLGPCPVQAEEAFLLPSPGQMVALSPAYNPVVLKGIQLDPKNPFRFHFFVDRGDSVGTIINRPYLKNESAKLIKYFLASLTIPEKDLWVNLSPYEKNRIVPQEFGQTEMGRDLLAQDYLLKQITATIIYPESHLGQEFWYKVYSQAQAKYGTTNIPINTFNKVWIVPDKAVVYENVGTAFVLENHLKVMLEEDYLSLKKHSLGANTNSPQIVGVGSKPAPTDVNQIGSQITREIVIPALTKEVNEGKNFSQLRQVFYSLILATWYKKKIKDSILNKIYSDRKIIQGLVIPPKTGIHIEYIYQQYLKAFKKGVYNYIKEEPDQITGQTIPRKFFSGGVVGSVDPAMTYQEHISPAQVSALGATQLVDVDATYNLVSNPANSQLAVSADAAMTSAQRQVWQLIQASPSIEELAKDYHNGWRRQVTGKYTNRQVPGFGYDGHDKVVWSNGILDLIYSPKNKNLSLVEKTEETVLMTWRCGPAKIGDMHLVWAKTEISALMGEVDLNDFPKNLPQVKTILQGVKKASSVELEKLYRKLYRQAPQPPFIYAREVAKPNWFSRDEDTVIRTLREMHHHILYEKKLVFFDDGRWGLVEGNEGSVPNLEGQLLEKVRISIHNHPLTGGDVSHLEYYRPSWGDYKALTKPQDKRMASYILVDAGGAYKLTLFDHLPRHNLKRVIDVESLDEDMVLDTTHYYWAFDKESNKYVKVEYIPENIYQKLLKTFRLNLFKNVGLDWMREGKRVDTAMNADSNIKETGEKLMINRRAFLRGLITSLAYVSTASDSLLRQVGEIAVTSNIVQPTISPLAKSCFLHGSYSFIDPFQFENQMRSAKIASSTVIKPESTRSDNLSISKKVFGQISPGLQRASEHVQKILDDLKTANTRTIVISQLREKLLDFQNERLDFDPRIKKGDDLYNALVELAGASDDQLEELMIGRIKEVVGYWKMKADQEGKILQEAFISYDKYQAQRNIQQGQKPTEEQLGSRQHVLTQANLDQSVELWEQEGGNLGPNPRDEVMIDKAMLSGKVQEIFDFSKDYYLLFRDMEAYEKFYEYAIDTGVINRYEQLKEPLEKLSISTSDYAMNIKVAEVYKLVPGKVIYNEEKSLGHITSVSKDRILSLLGDLQQTLTDGLSKTQVEERFFGQDGNLTDARNLVELASLLRNEFPYDIPDKNNTLSPLREAISKNIFFKIGEDKITGESLYISPLTKSFRRHFIFQINKDGDLTYAFEFMTPGEEKSRETFNPQNRQTVADDINQLFPGKEYAVNVHSARTIPYAGYDLYGKKWTAEGLQMLVYDYPYDGMRFTNITPDIKKVWAEEMKITTFELDRRIIQGIIECFLAVRLAGYSGKLDSHTENLRVGLVYDQSGRLIGIKVQLVGDFEDYVKRSKGLLNLYSNIFGDMFEYAQYFMFSPRWHDGIASTCELSPFEIAEIYFKTARGMFFSENLSLKDRIVRMIKLSVGTGVVFSELRTNQQFIPLSKINPPLNRMAKKLEKLEERFKNRNSPRLISKDQAMHTKGGIDLNPAQINMQVKNGSQDFKFDFNGNEIDAASIIGATFTIRNMTSVTNLPLLLGLNMEPSR